METVDIVDFLCNQTPLIDVRSPCEFSHAHIPKAQSIPLFTDEERSVVGTIYKQQGHQPALIQGLTFAGVKLALFAEKALTLGPCMRLYCFRGGMRSQSMAWLFEQTGAKVVTLRGGYKTFRRFALRTFEQRYQFKVLSGLTGAGKTEYLANLKSRGEQTLDLEELAGHRGSAFGLLGQPPQCSNEQFENKLALELHSMNPAFPIWVEDESRMIGTCKIPDALFAQFKKAPITILEIPLEERVRRLIDQYGQFPIDQLIESTLRLTKRLGGVRTKEIILLLQMGDLTSACTRLLEYYDAAYRHAGIENSPSIVGGTVTSEPM